MPGGALASSVGTVLGVGPGRGIALLLLVLGLMPMGASLALLLSRPDLRPDTAAPPSAAPPDPAIHPF
jgi:MFS transporter, DHA3 family, macrolide efflux protein